MTPNLLAATHALYLEFKTPAPRHIEACPCCTDEREIEWLIRKPLRELDADELSSYVSSLFHTVGNVSDYKYFLPRIFELALDDPPWSAGTEIVLDKLRLAEWYNWPASETRAVRSFIDAWFQAVIEEPNEPEDGIYYYPPVDELLCGMAHANIALAPYLVQLLNYPLALKALHAFNEASLYQHQSLANAFWEGYEKAVTDVKTFLHSDEVLDVLTR